jgi:DNA-binding response OmpR family regulator
MDTVIEAMRFDADDYIQKPCESEEMNLKIKRCLENVVLKRRLQVYENILAVCPKCKRIRTETGTDAESNQWVAMEKYIRDNSTLNIDSTYCPSCAKEFGELGIDIGLDLDGL